MHIDNIVESVRMTSPMDATEVLQRAQAIRLTRKDLALHAGLDKETIGRTLRGKTDPRGSTTRKLTQAVVAEELKLLRHLVRLHPEWTRDLLQEAA